jgi:O-antigen ligase
MRGNNVLTEESLGSAVQRVRLPGLSAAYVLFWYVVLQVVQARGRHRLAWTMLLAGIAVNIAVSFNRNMWTGLILGLVLMVIVAGPVVRARLGGTLGLAAAAVLAIALFGVSAQQSEVLGPVIERGSSILDPGAVSQTGSFRAREYETDIALDTIGQNLALGIGPGADFGLFVDARVGPDSFQRQPQLFLHNQYLYLLLVGGIPALIAFLVFLGTALRRAFWRPAHDPAIAACGVGIALLMFSSVAAIYFTTVDTTTMLGLIAGVIVADAEGPAMDELDSGLAP